MVMPVSVGDVFKVSSVIPFSQHIPIGSLYTVDTCPPHGYNATCRLIPTIDPHVLPVLTMFDYEIHNFFTFEYNQLNTYGLISYTPAGGNFDNSINIWKSPFIEKIECDCGAKTTYGANCNEFSHAHYCSISTYNKGVKNG